MEETLSIADLMQIYRHLEYRVTRLEQRDPAQQRQHIIRCDDFLLKWTHNITADATTTAEVPATSPEPDRADFSYEDILQDLSQLFEQEDPMHIASPVFPCSSNQQSTNSDLVVISNKQNIRAAATVAVVEVSAMPTLAQSEALAAADPTTVQHSVQCCIELHRWQLNLLPTRAVQAHPHEDLLVAAFPFDPGGQRGPYDPGG